MDKKISTDVFHFQFRSKCNQMLNVARLVPIHAHGPLNDIAFLIRTQVCSIGTDCKMQILFADVFITQLEFIFWNLSRTRLDDYTIVPIAESCCVRFSFPKWKWRIIRLIHDNDVMTSYTRNQEINEVITLGFIKCANCSQSLSIMRRPERQQSSN